MSSQQLSASKREYQVTRGKVVRQLLLDKGVEELPWPALFAWHEPHRACLECPFAHNRENKPQILPELTQALREELDAMRDDVINNLLDSMRLIGPLTPEVVTHVTIDINQLPLFSLCIPLFSFVCAVKVTHFCQMLVSFVSWRRFSCIFHCTVKKRRLWWRGWCGKDLVVEKALLCSGCCFGEDVVVEKKLLWRREEVDMWKTLLWRRCCFENVVVEKKVLWA